LKDKIINEIKNASSILVAGHIGPDGDDVSSVVSLVMILEKIGKNVIGVIDDEIPDYLKGFNLVDEKIRDFDCVKNNPSDLIIVVDASSPDRVGRIEELFEFRRTAVIDHHATNTNFCNINWVDSSYASTAQMVYEIGKSFEVDYDKELATINLLGIATDTGFFRYSNTGEKVFSACMELTKLGADISEISNKILENKPLEHLMLTKEYINNMGFNDSKSIVYSFCRLSDIEKYGISPTNTPPFVGELRSLKGVEVAIMFNEAEENLFHVSLRSKKYADVSKIAFEMGGGGHPRASGFSLKTNNIIKEIEILVQKIESLL
jgi:phosphoesterase RecJ-like protein